MNTNLTLTLAQLRELVKLRREGDAMLERVYHPRTPETERNNLRMAAAKLHRAVLIAVGK